MKSTPPPPPAGVTPTKINKPGTASLCSVFLRKICATPSGDATFGMATGFLYRDAKGRTWLVTNWHVLTGRRPDDPGFLLYNTPQSPYKVDIIYPGPTIGNFLPPVSIHLYRDGKPIWRQYRLDAGIDVAAIPVSIPYRSVAWCVQDFSEQDTAPVQPGTDVIIVGFPFEQGVNMPFPVWKRAMVATEPAYTVFGQVQTLLDTAGTPGMSGSPVYRVTQGHSVTADQYANYKAFERGDLDAVEWMASVDVTKMQPAPLLSLVGVYAGSTATATLDRLSLGRMLLASTIDLICMDGEPGENPFPPIEHSKVSN